MRLNVCVRVRTKRSHFVSKLICINLDFHEASVTGLGYPWSVQDVFSAVLTTFTVLSCFLFLL